MRYLLLLGLMLGSSLLASSLVFVKGEVIAHTEVFGDSEIDPKTSSIISKLTMDEDVTTIRGDIDISLVDLKSDNDGRDEHMHEVLGVNTYMKTTFTIENVKEIGTAYEVNGTLNLHGVKKSLTLSGDIVKTENKVRLTLKDSFNMSDFGIEAPTMLFFTVRDKVDITVDTTYDIK